MTSAFIGAAMLVVLYSQWVRRDTWWSRWEAGLSTSIALEGCGVLLLSPWAAQTIGPWVHRIARIWNLQQLAGHICIVIAISYNVYHVLLRMADPQRIQPLFRRQVVWPARVGVAAMVVVFVIADAGYRPDGFATGDDGAWGNAYWVVLCGLLLYLSGYATRVLLLVRSDPRAKATVELYAASAAFVLAAMMAQLSTTWTDDDVSTLVWLCASMALIIFAYGAARSWRAKAAWFTAGRSITTNNPPQALS